MKINSIKTISKTIYLLDKRITELLLEKEIDVNKIDTLASTRLIYVEELHNLIRIKNTREMFNNKTYDRRK